MTSSTCSALARARMSRNSSSQTSISTSRPRLPMIGAQTLTAVSMSAGSGPAVSAARAVAPPSRQAMETAMAVRPKLTRKQLMVLFSWKGSPDRERSRFRLLRMTSLATGPQGWWVVSVLTLIASGAGRHADTETAPGGCVVVAPRHANRSPFQPGARLLRTPWRRTTWCAERHFPRSWRPRVDQKLRRGSRKQKVHETEWQCSRPVRRAACRGRRARRHRQTPIALRVRSVASRARVPERRSKRMIGWC